MYWKETGDRTAVTVGTFWLSFVYTTPENHRLQNSDQRMSGDLCWKLDKREEKPRAKNQKTTNKQKIVERLKKLQDGNRERGGPGTRWTLLLDSGLASGPLSHTPDKFFHMGGLQTEGEELNQVRIDSEFPTLSSSVILWAVQQNSVSAVWMQTALYWSWNQHKRQKTSLSRVVCPSWPTPASHMC